MFKDEVLPQWTQMVKQPHEHGAMMVECSSGLYTDSFQELVATDLHILPTI